MFPSHVRANVKLLFQDIAPKRTGNTAFNAIIDLPINNGFDMILREYISPYGIKLDKPTGKWYRGHAGFFSVDSAGAGLAYIKGQGGVRDGVNTNHARLVELAKDNPARQRQYTKSITESGGLDGGDYLFKTD